MAEMRDDKFWAALTGSVEEILSNEGRSAGPLTVETSVNGDLEISSLDFVHLLLSLEEKLGQSFAFEQIALKDGQYRADLTLGELWEFMAKSDRDAIVSSTQFSAVPSN